LNPSLDILPPEPPELKPPSIPDKASSLNSSFGIFIVISSLTFSLSILSKVFI
jgi:hypothetical protein